MTRAWRRPAHWAAALGAVLQLTSPRTAADPMRPLLPPVAAAAANAAQPAPAGSQPAAPAGSAAAAAPATPATAAAPALQAIRQDSTGRWQALFGERWLSVGERLDGLTVSAIDGNSVRLGQGASARTWHLLPVLQAAGANANANANANSSTTATAGFRSPAARAPHTGTP